MTSRNRDNDLVDRPEPYYTNEDVVILHDIVVHAQELLPTLPASERVPTNALFNAYYAILPTIGLDADHDSRYARVLFKIGGMRGDGNLYTKFENVLSRMGIEIQFDQENDNGDHQEDTHGSEAYSDTHQSLDEQSRQPPEGVQDQHRRRNSESSVWDFGTESARAVMRPRSLSQALNLDAANIESLRVRGLDIAQTAGQKDRDTRHTEVVARDDRIQDIGTWLKTNVSEIPKSLDIANSKHRTLHPHLPTPLNDSTVGRSVGREAIDDSRNLDEFNRLVRVREHPTGGQDRWTQSPTLHPKNVLDFKATLLRQHLARNTVLRFYRLWRRKTLQQWEDNANLALLARYRDTQILLRQAFDSWHTVTAPTRHFFDYLDKRTSRARNLFLLTKSFTHWAESASYEIQRTSVARWHILRIRYFKAWRDITAVNELKVRRHVIKKFFGIWQNQRAVKREDNKKALCIYQGNLVRKVFWIWFWNFCGRKAPAWWASKKKYKYFHLWLSTHHERLAHQGNAVDVYGIFIMNKVLQRWAQKTDGYVKSEAGSTIFRSNSSCSKYFSKWHIEAALKLPLRELQITRITRLKRNVIKTWCTRAAQERQATATDYVKIMREAWITWNHKLRCRALETQINERVVAQALYRWVLNERTTLARRLTDRRVMQASLHAIIQRSRLSVDKESRDVRLGRDFFKHTLQQRVLACWRSRLEYAQKRELSAGHAKAPTLLGNVFQRWAEKARHNMQLQKWALDGHFFFRTSKSLKAWKVATDSSKREKRRMVYAQLRRKAKVYLASRLLSDWRDKASAVLELNGRVESVRQNRDVVFGLEIFDRWRARTEEIAELGAICQQIILKKPMHTWMAGVMNRHAQEAHAVSFFEDRLMIVFLKKWSRYALQLRVQDYFVAELCEKHEKRLSRRIFIHWQKCTDDKRESVSSLWRTATVKDSQNGFGETERAETWSEFDDGHEIDDWANNLEGAGMSTPIPGYLKTPSRRTTQARAYVKLSSTTPSAALSTPAERLLRAQYSGGMLSSSRRTHDSYLVGDRPGSTNLSGLK